MGVGLWLLLSPATDSFLRSVSEMSLMLGLVNLLPAEGLDGGRVLGCLLPGIMTTDRWARLSGWLGSLSGLLTLTLGFLRSPQLFLYGLWLLLRQLKFRLRD
jgi:Zn-dependent protease